MTPLGAYGGRWSFKETHRQLAQNSDENQSAVAKHGPSLKVATSTPLKPRGALSCLRDLADERALKQSQQLQPLCRSQDNRPQELLEASTLKPRSSTAQTWSGARSFLLVKPWNAQDCTQLPMKTKPPPACTRNTDHENFLWAAQLPKVNSLASRWSADLVTGLCYPRIKFPCPGPADAKPMPCRTYGLLFLPCVPST